jgi:hypothetical protein
MTDVNFACRVDVFDDVERARYEALRTAMKAAVAECHELPNGYAIRLASDPDLFRDVAEWVALERRCCPFLALGLEWSMNDNVWLNVTGGPSVKAFLAERLASAS